MVLTCGVTDDSWESLGLQGDQTSQSQRKSVLNIHWKDWCWSWNSNTLATWCEELTLWKRPWCWERLKAGGEGDDRGWDGWMASLTPWTWVWASSRGWWWTGRPGVLQSMGSQRVGHDWANELSWRHSSNLDVHLTDEWIKQLWHISTMEYYSAIKRNTSESILMRCMKLEPIIQSEESQTEKNKYHIITHILESRKMVLMNLFAGQQWRNRHREQTYGHG